MVLSILVFGKETERKKEKKLPFAAKILIENRLLDRFDLLNSTTFVGRSSDIRSIFVSPRKKLGDVVDDDETILVSLSHTHKFVLFTSLYLLPTRTLALFLSPSDALL